MVGMLLLGACADDYPVVINAERLSTDVSLAVQVCDTSQDCDGFHQAFVAGSGPTRWQIGIEIRKAYTEPAIRVQFQQGGTTAHCEMVEVNLETKPISFKATVTDDGSFVAVDCVESGECLTPITCPDAQ